MHRLMAFVLAAPLVAGGCGLAPSPEDRAAGDARANALKAANALYGRRDWPADDLAHSAAELDGVEVLGKGAGRVVVRVRGTAWDDWPGTDRITVSRCFELRFTPDTEWGDEPEGVRCPPGPALAFAPWPKTPRIPSAELERALPRVPRNGTAGEAEVRRAVASLRLAPAIRTAIKAEGGVVGVSLRVSPRLAGADDCTLARVAPGSTRVWSPPRAQRLHGEAGCDIGSAIDPLPPPH